MTGPGVYSLADLLHGGRGLSAPFFLDCRLKRRISHTAAAPATEAQLTCQEILRHLPGRRMVVRARYRDAQYAVKLFFGRRARHYFLREIQGLLSLQSSGVGVPELHAELELAGGGYGVVTQWLRGADVVREDDHAAVLEVIGGLGQLHAHGALRTDPNLRNYLRCPDGSVYAIDGDGVRSVARLGRTRGLRNLARLLAEFPPAADDRVPEACQRYSSARWQRGADSRLVAMVGHHLARQRKLRTRRFLKKTLRECSEFHCERTHNYFVACVRPAWGDGMRAFTADPEQTFNRAEVIKAGNSATVIRTCIDGVPVVIKRYNVKSWFHGVRRELRWKPRYRVSWCNGHRMEFLRLSGARHIALLERKHGPLKTIAYLVTEDCGSLNLESVVGAEGLSTQLVEQVVAVFCDLQRAGLVHGDTKASNFLISAQGVCLVDLDAMKSADGLTSDVQRFLCNWERQPEIRARFGAALQAAGMPL